MKTVGMRLEGGADAAAGERRGVRLLLGEHLAVEGFDHAAFSVVVDQGVVFLGSTLGQGLEPVGDVGHAVLHRPFFHAAGHAVGGLAVKGVSALDAVKQGVEAFSIKILAHLLAVEHEFAEVLGSFPSGNVCRNLFPLEGFLD